MHLSFNQRYVLFCAKEASKGSKLIGSAAYLNNRSIISANKKCKLSCPEDFHNLSNIIGIFEWISEQLVSNSFPRENRNCWQKMD